MTSVQHLKLAESLNEKGEKFEACYPRREESRKLALGNWKFLLNNLEFCLTLGGVYSVAALLLLWWRGYGLQPSGSTLTERIFSQVQSITTTPMFLVVAGLFTWILYKYADLNLHFKRILGPLHAIAHLTILLVGTALVTVTSYSLLSVPVLGDILYFDTICIGMVIAGVVGGIVWGFYLLICSYCFEGHANDAFSAMRLNSYRHFLRMKIEGNKLTIFPIGIDQSPERQDWQKNPAHKEWDQDTSYFVPRKTLGQRFIEKPIVVDADLIKSIAGAKFT